MGVLSFSMHWTRWMTRGEKGVFHSVMMTAFFFFLHGCYGKGGVIKGEKDSINLLISSKMIK